MYSVYTLSSPKEAGVRYVGITRKTLSQRLAKHFLDDHNPHKRNWLLKMRRENVIPVIEPVISGLTVEQAAEFERQFIVHLRSSGLCLLNIAEGGRGHFGYAPTEETREKMRASHLGKRLSEAAKLKLSLFFKGRPKSEEHARNISLGKLGMPKSPEHKEKLRVAITGKKASLDAKAKMSASGKLAWEKRRSAGYVSNC